MRSRAGPLSRSQSCAASRCGRQVLDMRPEARRNGSIRADARPHAPRRSRAPSPATSPAATKTQASHPARRSPSGSACPSAAPRGCGTPSVAAWPSASMAMRRFASARRKSFTRRARNSGWPVTTMVAPSRKAPPRAAGSWRITCARPPSSTSVPGANSTAVAQRGEALHHPGRMRRQQRHAGAARGAHRQRHHHLAGAGVDAQADAPRARRAAPAHRAIDRRAEHAGTQHDGFRIGQGHASNLAQHP